MDFVLILKIVGVLFFLIFMNKVFQKVEEKQQDFDKKKSAFENSPEYLERQEKIYGMEAELNELKMQQKYKI